MAKKVIERLMIILSLIGIGLILYLVISSAMDYSKQQENVQEEISTEVEQPSVEEPAPVVKEEVEEEKEEIKEEVIIPEMSGFVFDQDTMKQPGYIHKPKQTMKDLTEEEQSNIRTDTEDAVGYLYNVSNAMETVTTTVNTVQFNGVYSDAIYNLRECTGEYKDLKEAFFNLAGNAVNYIDLSGGKEIPFDTAFDVGVGLSNWEDFFEEQDYSIMRVDGDLFYQVVYYFTEEVELGKVTYLCTVYGAEENPKYSAYGVLETEDGRMFAVSLYDSMYNYTYAYINDVFTNCLVVVE